MKRIGLILANPKTNFGAHLQAYATQYVIDKLNCDTEVIDCSSVSSKRHYFFDWGLFVDVFKSIINKFRMKNVVPTDDKFVQNKKEREQKINEFRAKRLHDISIFKDYNALVQYSNRFDTIVIGSDQMWTPGISFTPINSLRFVPKGVRRVSYATSLGVSSYPRYCWNSARNMWKRMDYISVREEQGANIIKEICGKKTNVKVVVDPTYLMAKEQWEEVIPFQKMSAKRYVFCYFLSENIQAKKCARRYADKYKLHLVSILSTESYLEIDQTYADETIGAVSPEDFINWIRGAECVFTDSFHGLAFSVINHVQFYVFYRIRKDSKQSRNSRIDNILKMWNCEDRLINNADLDWNSVERAHIDYEKVENLVALKRGESLNYLKKAIGVDEN